MSIAIPGKIIVFDYGEVISAVPSAADRAEIVQIADVMPDALWSAYWALRDGYDDGSLTAPEYWNAIARDVSAHWDAATIHRLWLADFRSWLQIDPGTLDVLIDLKDGGTRMALLSNAAPEFSSYYRHGVLGPLFEKTFTSSELGVLKPDPAIFEMLLLGLSADPAELIFVDDRPANVHAARALGIAAVRYTNPTRLRQYLEKAAIAANPHDA